uniref:Uncharacterized protein n=1 Tax=Arundo donax TaxID=35708 RepID=A0A0A9BAH6_ARUDO
MGLLYDLLYCPYVSGCYSMCTYINGSQNTIQVRMHFSNLLRVICAKLRMISGN